MLQVTAQFAGLPHAFLQIMRQQVLGQMLAAVPAPLVDGLHVHLRDLAVHQPQPLGLRMGPQMHAHDDVCLDVRQGGDQLVGKPLGEIAHHQALMPRLARARAQLDPTPVARVDGIRGHAVLRAQAMRTGERILVECETHAGAQHPVQHLEPFRAVEFGASAAAHGTQLRDGPQGRSVERGHGPLAVLLRKGQRQVLVAHGAARLARQFAAHMTVEILA